MPYYARRSLRLCGQDYGPGAEIALAHVRALKQNVLAHLIGIERIEFRDIEPAPAPPIYKGRGWWQYANGMKVRGTKDKPPQLVGA